MLLESYSRSVMTFGLQSKRNTQMSENPITGRADIPQGPDGGMPGQGDLEISDQGIQFTGEPASHVLLFTGVTLAASMNVIRGTDLAPTRTSGWIAFTGTVTDTPTAVYTDYRELHTNGVGEVLGIGSFPFMDSGATCASMFAGQFICEADSGSTVLTAGGLPAIGIFPIFAKLLLNGETFNSGGVGAAIFLSVQANVTDVAAEDVSMINAEVASGGIRSLLRFRHSAGAMATNFLEIDSEVAPVGNAATGFNDPNAVSCDKNLKVKIGSTVYMIPLYQAS